MKPSTNDLDRLSRRISARVLPLLFLLNLFSFLDRVNIGFASLRMNEALGLTPADFGFAAGVTAIGYILFEVPGSLVIVRMGAPRWLGTLAILWGMLSAATAWVDTPPQLYVLRFLVGAAEAGFIPGMVFYLGQWFAPRHRARAIALLWSSGAVAVLAGAPLSAAILANASIAGWASWRWLFVVEGLPSILLGVAAFVALPRSPAVAAWLSPADRDLLSAAIAAGTPAGRTRGSGLAEALASPQVWLLGTVYFTIGFGFFALTYWLPQIVRGLYTLTPGGAALLTMLPFVFAAPAMIGYAALSDGSGERRRYVIRAMILAALGFGAEALLADYPLAAFIALVVAAVGVWSTIGIFWSVPATVLNERAAAPGIAIINTLGSCSAIFGPWLVGILKGWRGGYSWSFALISGLLVAGALLLSLSRQRLLPPQAVRREGDA